MKTRRLNLFLAIAISVLGAACSNDEETLVNDGRVHFTSGVNASSSRVGGVDGDEWNSGDPIGVYMVEHNGTAIAEGAENRLYKATQNGKTTGFDATDRIYYPVNSPEKVDFIAYHPHNASVSNYIYPVNTINQGNQSGIDLMRATANNNGTGYDKSHSATQVNLEFNHQLTKIILTMKKGAGITEDELKKITVSIEGLKTEAKYDISTGSLSDVDKVNPITTFPAEKGERYEAIVIPQSFANNEVTMKFALNNAKGEVLKYEVPATTFQAAKKHVYEVTVQREEVQVTGKIISWESVGSISGIAN